MTTRGTSCTPARRARDWDNQMLDPGHDDYYGTGTACGDIATSPFWTATSNPGS